MAKIKKIVTEGVGWCEHCEHVGYCPYPDAAETRAWAADFLGKTYKKPKEFARVEVECRYQELAKIPLYELDLPKILKEHQGYKVSRFEDGEVYVYPKVQINEADFMNVVGFIHKKGAHYAPYPPEIVDDYIYTHASRIRNYICDRGRVPGKNYGQWLKDHDDELRWCFEMMAQGQEPEPFK